MAYYDKYRCQWYEYDDSGRKHYGDTPDDADEAARMANERKQNERKR